MVFLQSVDIVKYSDEEYEKHLTDPVGTNCVNSVYLMTASSMLCMSSNIYSIIVRLLDAYIGRHNLYCCQMPTSFPPYITISTCIIMYSLPYFFFPSIFRCGPRKRQINYLTCVNDSISVS